MRRTEMLQEIRKIQRRQKTNSKKPRGLEGLIWIMAFSRHPLVAIGGLNPSNAEAVVTAGADSVAVVSAICASPDPYAASRELTGIIDSALASQPRRTK